MAGFGLAPQPAFGEDKTISANRKPISAENKPGTDFGRKEKTRTKAHFCRKKHRAEKRLARGETVVEIIAAGDVVVGPRRAGAPPPPAATRQARCEADRPSRLSRLSDRRQAAPPGRGSACAPAHPAVRRPLSRLLEVQRLAGVGSLGRVACLWRLESVSSFWTGCSLNCFGLFFFRTAAPFPRALVFSGRWRFSIAPAGSDAAAKAHNNRGAARGRRAKKTADARRSSRRNHRCGRRRRRARKGSPPLPPPATRHARHAAVSAFSLS